MADEQAEERREQLRAELTKAKLDGVKVLIRNLQSDVPIAQVMAARAILELPGEILEAAEEAAAENLYDEPFT